MNKLIYDKALEIGRAAALDELENNHANANINVNVGSSPESNTPPSMSGAGGAGQWDIQACLLAYETAAVMLSCLLSSGSEGEGAGGGAGEMEETTGLTVEPCECPSARTELKGISAEGKVCGTDSGFLFSSFPAPFPFPCALLQSSNPSTIDLKPSAGALKWGPHPHPHPHLHLQQEPGTRLLPRHLLRQRRTR